MQLHLFSASHQQASISMIPESKFNRLTQTDTLKLHVHHDTSIQEINVSENDDWIYVQGTLNSGIYPDLRSSNDTAIELNQSYICQ